MLIPLCISYVFLQFSAIFSLKFQLFIAACVVKRGRNVDLLLSTRLTLPKSYSAIQTALTCVLTIQNVWVSTSGGTRRNVIWTLKWESTVAEPVLWRMYHLPTWEWRDTRDIQVKDVYKVSIYQLMLFYNCLEAWLTMQARYG